MSHEGGLLTGLNFLLALAKTRGNTYWERNILHELVLTFK